MTDEITPAIEGLSRQRPIELHCSAPLGAPLTDGGHTLQAATARLQQTQAARAGLLSLVEQMERLGDAPQDADLAEAVANGLSLELVEAGLRHPGGFASLARALRHEASRETRASVRIQKVEADTSAAMREFLACGGEILIDDDLSLSGEAPAIVVDLMRFIRASGLDQDALDEACNAARTQLGQNGIVIAAGLGAALLALGRAADSQVGAALIAAVRHALQGTGLRKADADCIGLPAKRASKKTGPALVVAPIAALTAEELGLESQGLASPTALILETDDGPRLSRSAHFALAREAPEKLAHLKDQLARRGALEDTAAITTEKLRARGFTLDAISRVRSALGEGLPLSAAFSRWVLGDEIISNDLKLAPDLFDADGHGLLSAIGFSRRDIEAAEAELDGQAERLARAALDASGISTNNTPESRLGLARAIAPHLDAPPILRLEAGPDADGLTGLGGLEGLSVHLVGAQSG
ncbi:MAG: hypothetical protein AAGI03_03990, partial [Pseudomonadota bacterium]